VEEMAGIIRREIAKSEEIIGSSRGKDIISFVGNTGAGKSTVVNLLAGFPLIGDGRKRFVLKDKTNEKAMEIGTGKSVTSYPKGVSVGSRVLFDFPGFADTRGSEQEIVNSALMFDVFNGANTVLAAFVIGWDEVTSGHGIVFKRILEQSKKWLSFGGTLSTAGKCFIFTKSDEESIKDLREALEEECSPQYVEMLKPFFSEGRVFQMHRPEGIESARSSDRVSILSGLMRLKGIPVNEMKIGVTLSTETSSHLARFFLSELSTELESRLSDLRSLDYHGSLDVHAKGLAFIRRKQKELSASDFFTGLCSSVGKRTEMSLLIQLSRAVWKKCTSDFQESKMEYHKQWIGFLKMTEERITKEIQDMWNEIIGKKADEFVNEQRSLAKLGSSYSSLALARKRKRELEMYLSSFSKTRTLFSTMIWNERSLFYKRSGVLTFDGQKIPGFLEQKLNDLETSVGHEIAKIRTYISQEEARIRTEEAERRRQEEAQKAEKERQERLRMEKERAEASRRERERRERERELERDRLAHEYLSDLEEVACQLGRERRRYGLPMTDFEKLVIILHYYMK